MSSDNDTNGAPEVFLVQTTDLALRQISRSLVSTVEWWRTKFPSPGTAGPRFTVKPVREHLGMLVFTLDLPVAILDAMLHMMHVPETREEYWQHLPPALVATYTLATWRGYMREFGFATSEDVLGGDDEPLHKKQRILSPFDLKLERVATAFYAYIQAHHPLAAAFSLGVSNMLRCHFIANYGNGSPKSFVFVHADLELADQQVISWFLQYKLTEKQRSFFLSVLKRLSPVGTEVCFQVYTQRNEQAKPHFQKSSSIWPLSPDGIQDVSYSVKYHEVHELKFSYE